MQPWALPALLPNTIAGGAIASGISGGVASVVATGRPESFPTGFAQGVATWGVGETFGHESASAVFSWDNAGRAVAHGTVGGTFAVINGGEFSAGFLAAGFSSAAGPTNIGVGGGRNVVLHAVLGGTGSVLGGGKFEDGAVTGSFEYLFNQAAKGRKPTQEEFEVRECLGMCHGNDPDDDMTIMTDEEARSLRNRILLEAVPILVPGVGEVAVTFKTVHYASRLTQAGVNVVRAEAKVAEAVRVMAPSMEIGAPVRGRLFIDGVKVEYRAMKLPNDQINVGTIHAVKP